MYSAFEKLVFEDSRLIMSILLILLLFTFEFRIVCQYELIPSFHHFIQM
jgi:hypothetical protein